MEKSRLDIYKQILGSTNVLPGTSLIFQKAKKYGHLVEEFDEGKAYEWQGNLYFMPHELPNPIIDGDIE